MRDLQGLKISISNNNNVVDLEVKKWITTKNTLFIHGLHTFLSNNDHVVDLDEKYRTANKSEINKNILSNEIISSQSNIKKQQSDSFLTFHSTVPLNPRETRTSISNNTIVVDLEVKNRITNKSEHNKDTLFKERISYQLFKKT